jgi:hypothetical protein
MILLTKKVKRFWLGLHYDAPWLKIERMTAVEIIEEIKRLPRAEQDQVIDFVRKAGEVHPLTPDELGELAKKMIEAQDPAESDRLQAEIVRGFYGGQADA